MSIKGTLEHALALAGSGDWQGAHALIDDLDHPLACWLHASLHREEGDAENAGYWYRRAHRAYSNAGFDKERTLIAAEVEALKATSK